MMLIDMNNAPVSPVFVLAAAAYGALSVFATGPEIASREIARSDWQMSCAATLTQELETSRAPQTVIPEVPDLGGMLCSVYPEFRDLCALVPGPNAAAREAQARLQRAEDARIAEAVSRVGDQCSCAQTVYLKEEYLSLGLYAASGRLITPQVVEHRDAALAQALRSPACAAVLGG